MSNVKTLMEKLSEEQRAVLAMKTVKRKKAENSEEGIPVLPRNKEANSFQLSFAQQRLWFMEQFESGSSKNNFCNSYRIKGFLNIEALEYALNKIIQRHEIWRTTFHYVQGEGMQTVAPELQIKVETLDFRGKTEEEVYDCVEEIVEARFDLTAAPLANAIVIKVSEEEQLFLWKTHHIANDGWSIENFVNELEAFYRCFTQGEEVSLPELPVQYADFSVWQRNWLKGEALEKQIY